MKKLLTLVGLALVAGCMSVIRLCPREHSWEMHKDPVSGEWYKTNEVYGAYFYPMCLYPSLHLRGHLFAFAWREAPPKYEWRHFWGPVAGIVSCIGLPGDLLVDTCCLPWDIDTVKEARPCPICRESNPKE
jgi:hypothetical protein